MPGNANSGKGPHSDKHTVEGKALIPAAVDAALGAKPFGKVMADLTDKEREFLARSLRCDLDEWRREFGAQLRCAAQDLLLLTVRDLEKIPPAARGYTLAVLSDKALALEGRNTLQAASVNIQVNNFNGTNPKEAILAALAGKSPAGQASEPIEAHVA